MDFIKRAIAVVGGTALVGLATAMALTNPSRDTYEEYAVERLTTYLKEDVCTQVPVAFGEEIERQCTLLVDTGRPQIEQIISEQTTRQNYILFSVYTTNLDVGPFLPAYHFETIAAFQKFYVYQARKR
jgi:hypothetical protein